MVKVLSLGIVNTTAAPDPIITTLATELSSFGFFQRPVRYLRVHCRSRVSTTDSFEIFNFQDEIRYHQLLDNGATARLDSLLEIILKESYCHVIVERNETWKKKQARLSIGSC